MSRFLLIALLYMACVTMLACVPFSSSYQEALKNGNEAAAISTLQMIVKDQLAYSLDNRGAYGTFPSLVKNNFLDERFNSDTPKVNGYVFTMTMVSKGAGAPKDSFSINADPDGPGAKGRRHFHTDVSGSIHVNESQPATATDPLFTEKTDH